MGWKTHLVAVYFLCCSERLFPMYKAFLRKNNWGNAQHLRKVMNLLWENVNSEAILSYEEFVNDINKQIP
ncbi:DUF416 family protein, partial [Spartinivicinus marinus]